MAKQLRCSIGQYSDAGRKADNQDFHGAYVPGEPQLTTKGIAIAIADGISSSEVSHIASQTAVKSFLEDYYCTADSWSVKTAVQRVMSASNSWLFAQNRRNHQFRLNKDKGYVCTFSALVFKSNTAHLFHVGDAQIYCLERGRLEHLTEPHRVWLAPDKSYLGRAFGIGEKVEIDYRELPLSGGEIFVLATDGVYEFVTEKIIVDALDTHNSDLDKAAKAIANEAFERGSEDNLTVQIVRVEQLPSGRLGEFVQNFNRLPFPPELRARMEFDGYEIIRDLHISSRSHVVLARDLSSNQKVAIKLPSTEGRQDPDYVERFLMEEWVANRLNNTHVLKPHTMARKRNYMYVATEYLEGQTLAQWMIDKPKPSLDEVRGIAEQIASGLQAFHRQEMLHQDLRPNNIMIDQSGTAKIIDFGSTSVAGVSEAHISMPAQHLLGTAQYMAPEYMLGDFGTPRSDIYSLACIVYRMLSGGSPYGTAVAKARTKAAQHRLLYQSVLDVQRQIPVWVDYTLKKALHPDPQKRYPELSEFIHDLRRPNPIFAARARQPLIERNPVRFWQGVSAILLLVIVVLLSLNN